MRGRCISAVALAVLAAVLHTGCSNTTRIKYVYHVAASHVMLPNGTVVAAPEGKHYALFHVNCVDNSNGSDGFFFNPAKLRDFNNQATQFNPVTDATGLMPPVIVPAGERKELLGLVVFLLDAPAQGAVILDLNHQSTADESVWMVNQTWYGPRVYSGLSSALKIADPPAQYAPEGWPPCHDKAAQAH